MKKLLTLLVVLALSACASTPDYETSLIVMRHGESTANAQKIIASNALGLGKTVGLTEKGRAQARDTAGKIKTLLETRPYKGIVIVASPFKRTVETADEVMDVLGIPTQFKVDPRFQERFFGVFEGQSTDNYEKVWAMDRAGQSPKAEWNVESLESVELRSQAALKDLLKAYPDHAIIIVTHGDVASSLITVDRGEELKKHRETGALTTAGFGLLTP